MRFTLLLCFLLTFLSAVGQEIPKVEASDEVAVQDSAISTDSIAWHLWDTSICLTYGIGVVLAADEADFLYLDFEFIWKHQIIQFGPGFGFSHLHYPGPGYDLAFHISHLLYPKPRIKRGNIFIFNGLKVEQWKASTPGFNKHKATYYVYQPGVGIEFRIRYPLYISMTLGLIFERYDVRKDVIQPKYYGDKSYHRKGNYEDGMARLGIRYEFQ